MELLDNVKGKLIDSIMIDLSVNTVDNSKVELLKGFLTESTENRGALFFNLKDELKNKNVKLKSRFQMPITRELVTYLNEQEILFHINP